MKLFNIINVKYVDNILYYDMINLKIIYIKITNETKENYYGKY